MEKVYMCPYDIDALPKETLCNDGLNFSLNEFALLICNKAVPRDGRIYFEFTVTSYNAIQVIRNIPLYVGVHKEPSFGVLNADCCIGSIYYEEGKDFDIIDQYKAERDNEHRVPNKIHYRIPAITDTVGVLIDSTCNTITIYNEGHILYSFSPSHFNLNDDRYFPCIYTSAQAAIKGHINFGKAGIVNIPPKAYSVYGYYYRRISSVSDIDFKFDVVNNTPTINGTSIGFDLSMSSDHELGDTVPLYTVSRTAKYRDPSNLTFTIDHKDSSNYDDDGCIVASNKGIPYYTKVYLECRVKNGTIDKTAVGIPIAIGLSNSQGTIMSKSITIPLYHEKQYRYAYKEIQDRVPYEHFISNMLSPVAMDQEKVVGLGFDLENQSISVYMDKILMCVIKTSAIKFRQADETLYFVMHDTGAFTGTISCSVNFGETQFEGIVPDGYMSLWNYYNHFYPIPLPHCPMIGFSFKILPYKTLNTKYLHFSFYVLGHDFDEGMFTKPGMNKLMKTFNTVSDLEPHLTGERTIGYLDDLIAKNNNGYYPDDVFDEKGESKGINIEITGNWMLSWDTYFDFTIPRFNMTHDLDFSMAAVQYLKHDLVFDVMVANYQSVVAGISISPVGVVTREAETASYKFGRSTYTEKGVDDFIDTQQYHLRLCATKYNATKKKREVVAYKDSDYQGFNDAIAAKDCDIMVEFNRCFVERTQDADGTEHFKTMDSTNKTSGALSPAFTRGSKTYTAIRIGKYPVNSSYMSMPNTTPLTGVTLDQMRSAARAKGQYVLDYATYCTLLMLMTVKYGSIDVRNTVGVGSATAMSSGRSDEILNNDGTATGNDAVESLWIENYWGNGAPKFVDAVMISGTNMDEVYITNDIANMPYLDKTKLSKLSTPTVGVDANKKVTTTEVYKTFRYCDMTEADKIKYWESIKHESSIFGIDAKGYASYTDYEKAVSDIHAKYYDTHTTSTESIKSNGVTKKFRDLTDDELSSNWSDGADIGGNRDYRPIFGKALTDSVTYSEYKNRIAQSVKEDALLLQLYNNKKAGKYLNLYRDTTFTFNSYTTTFKRPLANMTTDDLKIYCGQTADDYRAWSSTKEIDLAWDELKKREDIFGKDAVKFKFYDGNYQSGRKKVHTYSAWINPSTVNAYHYYSMPMAYVHNGPELYPDIHLLSNNTLPDGTLVRDASGAQLRNNWNSIKSYPEFRNKRDAQSFRFGAHSTLFRDDHWTSTAKFCIGNVIEKQVKDLTTDEMDACWNLDCVKNDGGTYSPLRKLGIFNPNYSYDDYSSYLADVPEVASAKASSTAVVKLRDTVISYSDATVQQIESVWNEIKSDIRVFYFFDGVNDLKSSDGVVHVNPDDPSLTINFDLSTYRGFATSYAKLQLEDNVVSFPDFQFTVPGGTIPMHQACIELLEHADWSILKNMTDIFTDQAANFDSALKFWDYYQFAYMYYAPGFMQTRYKDEHSTSDMLVTIPSTVPLKTATEDQMNASWSAIENYSDAFGSAAGQYTSYTAYIAAMNSKLSQTYDKSKDSSAEVTVKESGTTTIVTNKFKYLKKLAYSPDAPWALYPGELSTELALTPNKTWSVPTENVDTYPRGDQLVVVNGGDATDQTGLLYWDRVPTNFTGAQAYFMELVD